MKPRRGAHGVTIIELVMAITIAAIVVSMVFITYISLFKGYKSHLSQAQYVMEMVVARKKLLNFFADVDVVEAVEPARIIHVASSQAPATIAWTSGKLMRETKDSGIPLRDISFRLQTQDGTSSGVLLWDAHTPTGEWVGGARGVKVVSSAGGGTL